MLKLSQPNISEEAIAGVVDVLRSGYLVHGPESEAFEVALAEYLGCHSVILVSSGTAALHVSLLAMDIGPGDAVLVPDFTFPASANAIALTGARPVIVDVEPSSYTISVAALEDTIRCWDGPEILKGIMPVHEFGAVADMGKIGALASQYSLRIIEDAACALGARDAGGKVGKTSEAACFSFHPRKTLTTGEGGAIATSSLELADRMRRLRNHGMERTAAGMRFMEPATNYRMTNFQAALGLRQLPHLDEWIGKRHRLYRSYQNGLASLVAEGKLVVPRIETGHSLQTFMVVLASRFDRAEVIHALRERGIESNLGAQSLSAIGLYGKPFLPSINGGVLADKGLALPMFEQLDENDISVVCDAMAAVLAD